ncbi:MFS transporter [Methanocella sp. CWC-04]|uniref:MFS transporter n=1 Tax=Methanooceanicella nereidis TaxID=2052831 RepID=A0AAP2RH39_9EURY|nr:MFS transporter [Methanocella sp. CWC-04]MCD1296080.1 MFS transporter [Methanocella sp. CWC-04]
MTEMAIQEKITRNIKLNYLYSMLMNMMLDRGIWVLFLSFRGMSLIEIGLIESVFQLSSLLFGIPAGAISDILGRKVSLILSAVMKILSFIIILLSYDFIGFAASFALSAMSLILYNNASESITYDTCKITKKEIDYKKVYGTILALSFVATAAGIAMGGFIASTSFEYVYYASIVILVLALASAFFFIETRGVSENDTPGERLNVTGLFSKSIELVKKDPVIIYLLVISAAITIVDATIYMYSQKYFEAMSVPIYLIGLILSVDSLFAAGGAKFAYLLEKFGTKNVLVLIPAVIFISYIIYALLNNIFSVVLLYIATIFVVAFWPILSELINSRVPSKNRATVLAFKGQLSSMSIMVVFPIVGFFAEGTSLSTAFLWLVISMTPIIVFAVMKIRRIVF